MCPAPAPHAQPINTITNVGCIFRIATHAQSCWVAVGYIYLYTVSQARKQGSAPGGTIQEDRQVCCWMWEFTINHAKYGLQAKCDNSAIHAFASTVPSHLHRTTSPARSEGAFVKQHGLDDHRELSAKHSVLHSQCSTSLHSTAL